MTPVQHEKYHILYIGDDTQVTNYLTSTLDASTFSSHIYGTPEKALALLETTSLNLVIIELDSLGYDSLQITEHIRQEKRLTLEDLAILALITEDTQEKRNTCFEIGINDFIFKSPLSLEELEQKISQWGIPGNNDSFSEVLDQIQQEETKEQPLVDETQVSTFINFIGTERTLEIIGEFKEFFEKKSDTLFDPGTSHEEIAKELHAMASVSGNIGMKRFSTSCRTLMNALKEHDIEDRMDQMMKIQAAYNSGIEKLEELLQSNGDDS